MQKSPLFTVAAVLLAAATLLLVPPVRGQQPAAGKRALPLIPGLGPDPVLSPTATPAQKASYTRLMAERTRQRWNFILTDSVARTRVLNEHPNALLVETVRGRRPGAALDADMGEGRNAIYLAQQGWQVTGVDIAEQALAYAQKRAHTLGVPLTTQVHDMATYDWGTNKWDLIVLSYAGGRDYADRVMRALKPGGLVVLEAFHLDATQRLQVVGGDYRVFFKTNELPRLYGAAGLKIVRYEEPVGTADFTKEQVRLVKLVAQKPR
ncbi:class I SAM-dependent methyltransferase [Hymenobacter rubripertinctus]|uniref:Class I SAM-dependent methyltransferase n=1 Tax=Hymenobacter rubripertinctus TaxID=2029981 RepID=A0A418QPH1_9BACT|nr:class I SAM-dependent methyltransferase [Hymenobacter rubripertinctus]RIY07089.1 class I SAM-dependent methyltransferase [Hymenobacter rubripertinctus]